MMPFVVPTSGVLAAAALAFSLTLGGLSAVRAEESQTVILQEQEIALVPLKSIEALEKRIAYLEETVNALTEAWQHIDTHRICISDAKAETETCLTKSQLDALVMPQAAATPAQAPAPSPLVEPVESVATVEAPEAPAAVIASEAQNLITPAAPLAEGPPTAEATAPNE